jgi:hypothetical protein
LAGSSAVAKGLELKPEEIFGEFAEMVLKQLDESLAEVQRVVAEKLARAKGDFRLHCRRRRKSGPLWRLSVDRCSGYALWYPG